MNPLLLQKLISDAINENILLNWRFYVALFSVSILTALAAAYFDGWGKKKGEIAATKSDFEEIKRQLRETTSTSKAVELSLSRNDWIQRERNTLKRVKLEELLTAGFSIAKWSYAEGRTCMSNAENKLTPPIEHFQMLGILYFPELLIHWKRVEASYGDATVFFSKVRVEAGQRNLIWDRANPKGNHDEMQRLLVETDQFQKALIEPLSDKSRAVYSAMGDLSRAAYALMEQLTTHEPNCA